jgi:hypothetical protein
MTVRLMTVKSDHNINLAFMECFTSCVLTYLNILGRDYRLLLLDYWNLSYQYKTLLSGKEARQLPLDYLYGVDMKFVMGDMETLLHDVKEGKSVIYLCSASKLAYFPREFLGMESSGFQHSILIYGWNERDGRYQVTDPIVGTIVQMSPDEIVQACTGKADSKKLRYFTLEERGASFTPHDIQSCIDYCIQRNLTTYRNQKNVKAEVIIEEGSTEQQKRMAWHNWFSNRHSGIHALECFEEDIRKSSEWTVQKRESWIAINTMTINSIKRVREQVWNIYKEKASLTESQQLEGQKQLEAIIAAWNSLNFLLLKYKRGYKISLVLPSITRQLEKLKKVELVFLEWLHSEAGKGGR